MPGSEDGHEEREELCTDDTASLPDSSDLREVDIPSFFERDFLYQCESLRIREDHPDIEGILDRGSHLS